MLPGATLFGQKSRARLQSLFTFPLTISGGGQTVTDHLGNLITLPAGVPAIEGARYALTVAEGARLGAELVVNGNFATDSVWSKQSTWAISAGNANAVDAAGVLYQSVSVIGKRYQVIFTLLARSSGDVSAYVGGANGTGRTAPGTYTEELVATISTNSGVRGNNLFTGSIDNISIREVIPTPLWTALDGTPLHPYVMRRTRANGVVADFVDADPTAFPRYLSEGARTNLWYPSAPLTTDVSTTGTVTDVPTPARGFSRWLHIERAGSGDSFFTKSIAVTAGDHIFSAFIQMDDADEPILGTSGTGAGSDLALLLEGASSASVAPLAGKQDLGGGLWRVWGHRNIAADTTSSFQVRKYANQSGRSFTVTGIQLERGTFPSSYIPTTATTVTRPATVLSFPSANRLRPQWCAVRGVFIPTAGGQAATLFSTMVDGLNKTLIDTPSGTSVRLSKELTAGSIGASVAYTPVAGVPFEIIAYWTSLGIGIRVRAFAGGVWQSWGAWATNATNGYDAAIAATYELASLAGSGQYFGNIPEFAIRHLPEFATAADVQAFVMLDKTWE